MKTLKLFSFLSICLAVSTFSFAQKITTETFAVSGNCGMCKARIEKAANEAGATFALWDVERKELTVKYSSSTTNTARIQQQLAVAGHDNTGFKATSENYNKLPVCCKYEKATEKEDMMDCCKDGKCTKEGHDGKDCCKKAETKMDCCADGVCTREGHSGKDCCKKAGKQNK